MSDELYKSRPFTQPGGFTAGIEGPGCDRHGNLYAVNYQRQGTIGKVTPDGTCSVFAELSSGSIGNGIRFHSEGYMLVADYTNHNVLRIDLDNREIEIYAHEPAMNQPNDLAIGVNDLVYASDPNWAQGTGQIWRIDHQGQVDLLETGMGTTNGIEVSPDERTLYVNESVQRNVWAYDLSPANTIPGFQHGRHALRHRRQPLYHSPWPRYHRQALSRRRSLARNQIREYEPQ